MMESKNTGINDEQNTNKKSQADNIVDLLSDDLEYQFFVDQKDDLYVHYRESGHYETRRCNTEDFKGKISHLYWTTFGKTVQSTSIKDALRVLHGKAIFGGKRYELEHRLRWDKDTICYDLTNSKWDSIVINKTEGWFKIPLCEPLFRRERHSANQVIPVRGGDIRTLLSFVNIAREEEELLFLVYLISCFIPDFPHPIAYFYGPQGSAKSTMSKLLKSLVDPSLIDVSQMPQSEQELDQILEHHWFIAFDNLSFLNTRMSDSLCKSVTGVSSSKRKLYTDDEYVIYSYKRCLTLNGINLLALKPDLLERSILFELNRVDSTKRVYEDDFWSSFEEKKPEILGAIFSIVSEALKIRSQVKLDHKPRMADFAVWGYAIAEAMDGKGTDFLCAYTNNIKRQTMEILYEHPTASIVLAFMEDKERWTGTASQLLQELRFEDNTERKYQNLPATPNALSRSLAQIKLTLEDGGIRFSRRDGKIRSITLERIHTTKNIENSEN